jgi:hypothetical protein
MPDPARLPQKPRRARQLTLVVPPVANGEVHVPAARAKGWYFSVPPE